MCEEYVLEWLDDLITVKLSSAKSNTNTRGLENPVVLQGRLLEEKIKFQWFVKKLVFSLEEEGRVRRAMKQYHSCLVDLLDQALVNRSNFSNCPDLGQFSQAVVTCIEELLSFMEMRFSGLMDKNERVPATFLGLVRTELEQSFESLANSQHCGSGPYEVIKIVQESVGSFLKSSVAREHSCMFKEVSYLQSLGRDLAQLDLSSETSDYSVLDTLLISFNFNSRRYIDNLTGRIAEKLKGCEGATRKLETLLYYFKAFKQLPRKPEVIFDCRNPELFRTVNNWFIEEMYYLKKVLSYEIQAVRAVNGHQLQEKTDPQKISSILTVDQMGILLRAATDTKIVMAKSLNAVFKCIVPFLSTPQKKNISFDSMRSKSYAAEGRDKEIVIGLLEKMIERVEEF